MKELTPTPSSEKLGTEQVNELLDKVGNPSVAKARAMNPADRKDLLKQVDTDISKKYDDASKKLEDLGEDVDLDKVLRPGSSVADVSVELKWAHAFRTADMIKDKSLIKNASDQVDEMIKSGVPTEEIPVELKWAKSLQDSTDDATRVKQQTGDTLVDDTSAVASESLHIANSDLPETPASSLMNRNPKPKDFEIGGSINKLKHETPHGRLTKMVVDMSDDPTFTGVDAGMLAMEIKDLNPGSADWYVEMMFQIHDSSSAIRILQDNYFRSIDPGAAFSIGSHRDIVSGVMLTHGQGQAGLAHYEKFMSTKVLPFLDNEVTEFRLNRYLQAKNWADIQKNIPERTQFPDHLNEAGEKTSSEGWKNWISDMERDMTPEDFLKLETAAENVKLEYQRLRTELLEQRIITQEFHDELRDAWDWYLPNTYIEFMSNNTQMTARPLSNLGDGIRALSRDPEALKLGVADDIVTATNPLGESLAKNLIQHKLRIHRNNVARAFVNMGEEMQIGLVRAEPTLYGKGRYNAEGEKVIDFNDLYDEKRKSGYISFVEDGVRKIYGQELPDGTIGPVRRIWWDSLNGRAGISNMDGNRTERAFRTMHRWYRDNLTTFDPLFFAGNGLIDAFAVGLRYRIMPTTVAMKFASRVSGISRDEKRVADLRRLTGVYKPGITGRPYQIYENDKVFSAANKRRIMNAVDDARGTGKGQEVHILDGGNQKELDRILTTASRDSMDINAGVVPTNKIKSFVSSISKPVTKPASAFGRSVVKLGEIIEQAPRQAVFAKSLKRSIGNKKMWGNDEWNRIMNLEDIDFYDELYGTSKNVVRNVINAKTEISLAEAIKITPDAKVGRTIKTKGLLESPEVIRAAMNSMEATINFQRGGALIRKFNPYVLFLNAGMEGFKMTFRALGIEFHPQIRPVVNPGPNQSTFTWGSQYNKEGVVKARGWKKKPLKPLAGRGETGKTGEVLGDFGMGERASAIATLAMSQVIHAYITYQNMQHEEYIDVSDKLKFGSLLILHDPKKDENGEVIRNPNTGRPYPNVTTIPHSMRAQSLYFAPITYLMHVLKDEYPSDWGSFARALFMEASPLTSFSQGIPPVIKPIFELPANKNFYFDTPLRDPDLEAYDHSEQFTKYTTESARFAGETLKDWEENGWFWDIGMYRNPQIMDYVSNQIAPVGRSIKRLTDFALLEILTMRKQERLPWHQKVEAFKLMPKLEKAEYLASLSKGDRKKFEEARRSKPLSEGGKLRALFEATGIPKKFAPNRTGGINALQERKTQEKIKEAFGVKIDTNQSRRFYSKYEDRRQKRFYMQVEWTKWLNRGYDDNGEEFTSEDWREADRKQGIMDNDYFENTLMIEFPDALQSQSSEVKELWFDNWYTAAGTIESTQEPYMHWISAIHKIKTPDEDPTKTWTQYFSEVDDKKTEAIKYLEYNPMLRPDGTPYPDQIERFERQEEASWESGKKSYKRTNALLSEDVTVRANAFDVTTSYWDAGRDLKELYPPSQHQSILNAKNIALWKAYVENGYDETSKINKDNLLAQDAYFIRETEKRRRALRKAVMEQGYRKKYMGYVAEEALVYWYGSTPTEYSKQYKKDKALLSKTRTPDVKRVRSYR